MPVIVDTNLFVYRLDATESHKQSIARNMLGSLAARRVGFTSTQVISELANVLLGRRADLAQPATVRGVVAEVVRDWQIVSVQPHTIDLAFEGVDRFGFSWFDAQIWAAARISGCRYLLSEDFHNGLVADGVTCVNPFAPGFDVDAFLAAVTTE